MHTTLKSALRTTLATLVCLVSIAMASAQTEYTVLPGDTYARIARAHDLTLSELRSANPGRGESLAPGDLVLIPQPMQLVGVLSAAADGRAREHVVEAGQTLYAIAQLYGAQVEDLETWNPRATAGLSIGDVLIVGVEEEAVRESLSERLQSLGVPSRPEHVLPHLRTDTLRTLVMLPFMLEADTVAGGVYSPKTRRLRSPRIERFGLCSRPARGGYRAGLAGRAFVDR